ncbi:hypothetical protein ACN28I_16675 [Archangium gephyra]|uniref:hypothetical protein n=1 Tax=Archangium gephyra TaxID=48 RepID=UPI003B7F8509
MSRRTTHSTSEERPEYSRKSLKLFAVSLAWLLPLLGGWAGSPGSNTPDAFNVPDQIQARLGTALARTQWEMHVGGFEAGATGSNFVIDAPCTTKKHGDVCLYEAAVVPPSDDSAWLPAPNGDTINFQGTSALACLKQVDYTYFQTFVNIPSEVSVKTHTVDFSGLDDGARVTIYNSRHPSGLVVDGSYVFLGGAGTADLADLLTTGLNRIVVTQLNDCSRGRLDSAKVILNGMAGGVLPECDREVQGRFILTTKQEARSASRRANRCWAGRCVSQ